MKKLPLLIFGIFATFAMSWLGTAAYSFYKLGHMEPAIDEASGATNPPPLSGLAVAGQKVYASSGCVACHTQQVRPAGLSNDVAKFSAELDTPVRATVARDFLRESPAFVGSLRIGPDLSNVGLRSEDPNWFHRHLFEPRSVVPGSNMPSFRFLYKTRKITGQQSAQALLGLTGPHAPEPGFEVVPTEQAIALVAYLRSLKRNYPLPEAEPLK